MTNDDLFKDFLSRNENLRFLENNLKNAVDILKKCYDENKKILVCGNGGSACDAEHIAGELLKGFMKKRPADKDLTNELITSYGEDGRFIASNLQMGIKCIPLSGFSGFHTAYENDCNPLNIYAQAVNSLADKGDVLIGISTSGNSKNIVYAEMMAKTLGLSTISLTGKTGGKLASLSDVLLNAPSEATHIIQEYHIKIYHLLCLALENLIFVL